jgi:hypothetical protein
MAKVLGLTVVLVGLALAASAQADTVYLRNGQSFWGTDILEVGNSVIVVRPGGELRFPKAEVLRIERLRTTLPQFYGAPETPPPAAPGQAGAPAGPGAAGAAPEAPVAGPEAAPAQGDTSPATSQGGPASPRVPGSGPVQLPPPPLPPAPGERPTQLPATPLRPAPGAR